MEYEPERKITIDELARMMAEGLSETRGEFTELRGEMQTGFAAVNKRIDLLDQKVDRVDAKVSQHRRETKDGFAGVHRLIGGISTTLTDHEERLRELEGE
jgi:uncharacterized coiled-coil DUF342 family protein